ncbi:hypothetical protein FO519_005387 [Halicephalobus sp. NKZ332]|nr:hypothetical protein FO519_005387 [Halicephalobus sp. NKZ332]
MDFRSQKLKLCQLIVQKDASFQALLELGRSTSVQFRDTRVFEVEKDVRQFLSHESQLQRNYNEFREFIHVLQKVESFFEVHIENEAKTELEINPDERNELGTPLTPLVDNQSNPWFIAGTIETQKKIPFERVLWRACRRTAFVRTADIDEVFENPETGKKMEKSVFIIFFKGDKLQDIVNRVCEGFQAKQFKCPKSSRDRQLTIADITVRQHDLKLVLESTQEQKLQLMRNAAYELPEWQRQIVLQKTVYHTLNKFTHDLSGNFHIAECWVPEDQIANVTEALQRGCTASGSTVRPLVNVLPTDEVPPTYNKTNKFTKVFQSIVDSYGIACYREINPAPYTIITFPFLFAMMFGDFGHGLILVLAALFFISKEEAIINKKIRDEIFNAFFGGRYIIFLMGIFSLYSGVIYNDVFSKSVNIFGSGWKNPYSFENLTKMDHHILALQLDPGKAFNNTAGPYEFGLDPIWNMASNRLNFINSMKMKASIIVGISQMTLGIVLSFLNFKRKRSYADIFMTFIPQMIFLFAIFVYLCIQIFVKWIYFWVVPDTIFGKFYPGPCCAPSLLIGLINMFMFKPRPSEFVTYDESTNTTETHRHCHLAQWYPHQTIVESTLVIVAVACIPIMLFGKPIWQSLCGPRKPRLREPRKTHRSVRVQLESEEIELIPANEGKNGQLAKSSKLPSNEDHEGSDVMVHQAIHTIEFVLGCISHTASYLRLWALSLAHSQLSEVMWHMVLGPAFHVDGILGTIVLFVLFFIFFIMTVAILVLMEGLSAFLHAIRLHWVEFQSKFYEGTGQKFVPFDLELALKKFVKESDVY